MLPGVPGQLVLHPRARVPVRQDEQIYQNKYMSNHTDQENHNGKISSYMSRSTDFLCLTHHQPASHEKRKAYNFQT